MGCLKLGLRVGLGNDSGGIVRVSRKAQDFTIAALVSLTLFGCAPSLESSPADNQLQVTGQVAIPRPVAAALPQREGPQLLEPENFAVGADRLPFVRNEARGVDPFPLVLNRTVQGYVDAYLNQPEGLKRSVRRSSAYIPEMVAVLQERGLPHDLVYLSYAESGFSYRGAGPWQLSKPTARRYGLRVNQWMDERRDPIKSTRAAADYLTELHEQTGSDWRMTLVAWNNGENGVDRYMRLRDVSYDRLMLRLPRRTRSLMNRFMAVALIARDHRREFGLPAGDGARSPQYRTVVARGGTTFKALAQREHTSIQAIGQLNPALFRQCVPPGAAAYPVRLPLERRAGWELPATS